MKKYKNENGNLILVEEVADEEIKLSLEEQNAQKIAELQNNLINGETDFMLALEQWASQYASGELKQIADERIAVRATIDSLGKIVQTEGDGTAFNPYKTWTNGTFVKSGDWWQTSDGYLWQAIKSGTPASSTDKEYWDILE